MFRGSQPVGYSTLEIRLTKDSLPLVSVFVTVMENKSYEYRDSAGSDCTPRPLAIKIELQLRPSESVDRIRVAERLL
jgi:hypothetical protein